MEAGKGKRRLRRQRRRTRKRSGKVKKAGRRGLRQERGKRRRQGCGRGRTPLKRNQAGRLGTSGLGFMVGPAGLEPATKGL